MSKKTQAFSLCGVDEAVIARIMDRGAKSLYLAVSDLVNGATPDVTCRALLEVSLGVSGKHPLAYDVEISHEATIDEPPESLRALRDAIKDVVVRFNAV